MVYDLNGTALSAGGSSSGMLNVLDYGFKADGTTDNLAAFNALIAARPAETLYFPKGVYAFSGKLVFDQCYMELDNAELKCTARTKVNRFIEIRGKMYPPETPQQDMFIRGNGTRFSDCYIDTYQKGFQFGSGQYVVYITNLKWYVASNTWPTGLTAYVFPASPAGKTMYKVFNADINGSGVTKFSDEDLSKQMNCRWYGIVHNLSDAPSTLQ